MMTPMPGHSRCLLLDAAAGIAVAPNSARLHPGYGLRHGDAVARTERSELREATHDDADAGPLRMPIPKCCRRHSGCPGLRSAPSGLRRPRQTPAADRTERSKLREATHDAPDAEPPRRPIRKGPLAQAGCPGCA